MPLVDSNQAALWDGGAGSLYRQYRADGSGPFGYERSCRDRILGNDHWLLKQALNLQPGQSIALIGAGFGWAAEDWFASGLSPIVAVDTSMWIQANKVQNATVTILSEDGTSNASRGRIRQALGLSGSTRATWCISEDVLPVLSDAEAVQLATAMRQIGTNVAHWVSVATVSGDPRLNWKTLEAWKALVTPDKVVQRGTATAL